MYTYFILAFTIFVADRLSKIAALQWYLNNPRQITSFLSFDIVFNRGISWGMFHSTHNVVFMIVTFVIAMMTALVCRIAYHKYKQGKDITGEVCIIAGSLSNVVDRVVYGGVIDFIVLSYGNLTWPVFNIADAMIVIGVGLLLLRYEK
ncbi:MAG TPA: signal peptidase II [Candidatus Babeliales bacterium]|nr:signal peptidase II [Candidatus Babeliales bacterium]